MKHFRESNAAVYLVFNYLVTLLADCTLILSESAEYYQFDQQELTVTT